MTMALAAAIAVSPAVSAAQARCPELEAAKTAYAGKLSASNLKDSDIKPSRSLAGARVKMTEAERQSQQEAPRQGVQQAPRQSQQEAPRQSQQEAPRQSVQDAPRQSQQEAPRQSAQEAPHSTLSRAKGLITEAEAACKAGRTTEAASKANAALGLLK
jgi:hypothetical protein